MIAFTLRGEPCSKANSRKIVNFGERPAVIKSQKARDYERTAALQIPVEARQMLEGPVCVTLRIYYASERPDLDESIILDVLQAKYKRTKGPLVAAGNGEFTQAPGPRVLVTRGCYLNDRQVREKHVYWGLDRNNPRTEIEIEALQPQQIPLAVPEPPTKRQQRDAEIDARVPLQ